MWEEQWPMRKENYVVLSWEEEVSLAACNWLNCWLDQIPSFNEETECIAICMPGSSFIHIETS